jgi:N-sulfoglucosamine sulfohydrolase
LLDIFPTVLEWFEIEMPEYQLFGKRVEFTGKSLLPFTNEVCFSKSKFIYFGY